jgi:HEAT repeat protein
MQDRALVVVLLSFMTCVHASAADEPTHDGKKLSDWVQLLRKSDATPGSPLAKALLAIGKPAVPAVAELLRDRDEAVRSRAVFALALLLRARVDEAFAPLLHAVNDADTRVSGTALAQIAASHVEATPLAVKAFESRDAQERAAAAAALGRLIYRDKTLTKLLKKGLTDEDGQVRGRTAEAIRGDVYGQKDVLPALIAGLGDKVEANRGQFMSTLIAVGPAAIPALNDALKGEDVSLRMWSAYTLASLLGQYPNAEGVKDARETLLSCAADKDHRVRVWSAFALGKLDGNQERLFVAAGAAFKEKDAAARIAACTAVSALGEKARQLEADIVPLLADPDANVRSAALHALKQIGAEGDHASKAAVEQLKDKQPENRLKALAAIMGFSTWHKDVPQALIVAAGDDDAKVRASALQALGQARRRGAFTPAILKPLITAINDADNTCRLSALFALQQIGPEAKEAVAALTAAAADESRKDVYAVCQTLAAIGPEARAALPALTKLLKSPPHAASALSAMERIGGLDETHVAPLMAVIEETASRSPLFDPSQMAERLLCEMGAKAKSAVPALGKLLSHKTPARRVTAARILQAIGPEARAATAALAKALHDEHLPLRLEAAIALGNIGPDAKLALPDLIQATKGKDADVRVTAISAIGKIGGGREAIAALGVAMKDGEERTCAEAASALVRFGKDSVPVLEACLQSPSNKCRQHAVAALGQLGADANAALPTLEKTCLSDRDPMIRLETARALHRIGRKTKEILPVLRELLAHEEEAVRFEASLAAGDLGPAAMPLADALIERLHDANPATRRTAAVALSRQGKAVVGVLVKALDSPRPETRQGAALALGRIGGEAKEAVPALLLRLKDESARVMVEAAEAIKKIDPERAKKEGLE